MHNHVDHRWIKAFLRKIISILLVYSLFFTNTAHAANIGGWNISNGVNQGASVVYDATKNVVINGSNFVKKSWVKITPTASGVAKVLARGGAGYALSVAVEQILGAVDWVLDPANNRIVYKVPNQNNIPKLWQTSTVPATNAASAADSCSKYGAVLLANNPNTSYKDFVVVYSSSGHPSCVSNKGKGISFTMAQVNNPAYDPAAQEEEKYLPLDTVAQKVISNAAGGDAAAQSAVGSAAADIINEAEKDSAKARPIASQAEANATTKPADAAEAEKANEAQGEAKPNEANPEATDLSLTFPIFCNWAPTICEAAQTVISFPQTLTNWWEIGKSKAEEWALSISEAWTAAKEWAKNDENNDSDNEPPEIKEIDIGALDTSTFQGVAGCPAPIQVPITFGTGGETEISYEPICQLADKWSFVAPLIGFLSGAMILVGVGRKGEDGEI